MQSQIHDCSDYRDFSHLQTVNILLKIHPKYCEKISRTWVYIKSTL